MGDPGTKAALMLTMLAAEEIAFRKCFCKAEIRADPPRLPWRHFVAAGDDHLACGPQEYLEEIDRQLKSLGAEVNLDKCFISPIGAFYSEEFIINLPETVWSTREPIWKRPYLVTPHCDAIKVRLLSPCEKLTPESADEKKVGAQERDCA